MDLKLTYTKFEHIYSLIKENEPYTANGLIEAYDFQNNNDWEDYMLLLLALQGGHVYTVELLLAKGCRVRRNVRTELSCTPLFYAVLLKNENILKKLLALGASITDKDLNKETPLCLAISMRDFEAIDLILSMYNFDNINIFNNYCFIHFYVACMRNEFNVVKGFVERGMPVNDYQNYSHLDSNEYTPLHFAVKYINVEMVEFLLDMGADISAKNFHEQTAIDLANQLRRKEGWEFEERKKLNRIIDLLNTAVYVDPVDKSGIPNFHIACARDHLSVVERFLKNGVEINAVTLPNAHWYPSYTAGHFAIINGCVEVIKLLLHYGADFNMMTSAGDTFLHSAVEHENLEIVQELIKYNANINIQNYQGNTPLHMAFYKNNDDIVDLLLAHCPKNINPRNKSGLSHFHIACSRTNAYIVQKFLENKISIDQCVDVGQHNYSGYSPLHFAVNYNRLSIVKVLLQYNVNVHAKEAKGLTALHLACKQNHLKFNELLCNFIKNFSDKKKYEIDWTSNRRDQIEIIKLLLDHKANLNSKDNSGRTPLFHACILKIPYFEILDNYLNLDIKNKVKIILWREIFPRREEIINILVGSGADLKIRNDRNETILHYFLQQPIYGTLELFLLFINKGAEIDATDINNETPLHFAVKYKDIEQKNNIHSLCLRSQIVEILLKKGANPNVKGIDGMTLLHYCCISYCESITHIFEHIINACEDINAQDLYGRTPLHLAVLHNLNYAFKICLMNGADINILDYCGKNILSYLKIDGFYNNHRMIIHNLFDHIHKLKQLGFHIIDFLNEDSLIPNCGNIDVEVIRLLCSKYKNERLPRECQSEIERMKNESIDPSTSLYDLLLKTHHEISKYKNNKTFKTIAQSQDLDKKYIYYGYLLKLQFKNSLINRNKLLKPAKKSMEFFIKHIGIPEECLDEIFKHLDNRSLLILQSNNPR